MNEKQEKWRKTKKWINEKWLYEIMNKWMNK